MSLGFIGTFTILSILLDQHSIWYSQTKLMMIYPFLQMSIVFSLISYCIFSLWYRVITQLHTPQQITVGLCLGITNAIIWRRIGFTHGLTWMNENSFMTVQDWVSRHIIPRQGYLPMQYMIVPAIVGLVVVGSFERRISSWFIKSKQRRKDT